MINLEILEKTMPDMYFFKKDYNSVYIDACQHFVTEVFPFKNKLAIQGKTDFDVPCKASELAPLFQREDKVALENPTQTTQFISIGQFADNKYKILLSSKRIEFDDINNVPCIFAYVTDIIHIAPHLIQLIRATAASTGIKQDSFIVNNQFNLANNLNIRLTKRESEILFLLMRGKTPKQIAYCLGISVRTVEQYIVRIRTKFNCQSKAELIATAIDNGFFEYLPYRFLADAGYLSLFK
jgi:DNA-binding CsgD family transcriptional regulator